MLEQNLTTDFEDNGFVIINNIFSEAEVEKILAVIKEGTSPAPFKKTKDLFAIRQLFNQIPKLPEVVFNHNLVNLLRKMFSEDYFVSKAIYFDKPENSNWFVSYHQDLTISVDRKYELEGFGPWTVKDDVFGVQPPVEMLDQNFTLRIHLDDTTIENGALRVLSGSHKDGILRDTAIVRDTKHEEVCSVEKGGVMFMSPLLMHSSGRSKNGMRRRVIHIEFSQSQLPEPLKWAESYIMVKV